MQSLWSRVAPHSTCRCLSCWRTASKGISARPATAASKRRLRIANSVTALYSSVFCAAAVADAQAKDKRRAEWDEKIAAVREQVSQLEDEERRILESLKSRKRQPAQQYLKRRIPYRLPPVRYYSTAPRLVRTEDSPGSDSHSPSDIRTMKEVYNEFLANSSAAIENELMDDAKEQCDSLAAEDFLPPWAINDVLRLQAIQKLAVKQLAIRLLLRPSVAHSYVGTKRCYGADLELLEASLPKLFHELKSTQRRIRHLKKSADADTEDLAQDLPLSRARLAQQKVDELDADLEQDINLCMRHKISLEELLLKLSRNLLNSPVPDRPKAFRLMITGLSKMHQNDVVHLILKSLIPHYFTLNFSLIISILTFFRKSKDLKNFDLFLQMLRGEKHPMNLGKAGYFKKKEVNGVEVTVPPLENYNLVIYSTLITAALRFDQPERADAWHHIARNTGFMDNFATMYAYLKFYRIRSDWEKGVIVLRRALAFMVSSANLRQGRVERLIVLMVELCDACRKSSVSEALISAYVHSGFDLRGPESQLDCKFVADPELKRWHSLYETAGAERVGLPVSAKCSIFTNIVGAQADELLTATEPSIAKQSFRMMDQFSQGILSSVLPDTPAHARPSGQQSSSAPEYYYIRKSTANSVEQDEMKELKAEVARLKEALAQLSKSKLSSNGTT